MGTKCFFVDLRNIYIQTYMQRNSKHVLFTILGQVEASFGGHWTFIVMYGSQIDNVGEKFYN